MALFNVIKRTICGTSTEDTVVCITNDRDAAVNYVFSMRNKCMADDDTYYFFKEDKTVVKKDWNATYISNGSYRIYVTEYDSCFSMHKMIFSFATTVWDDMNMLVSDVQNWARKISVRDNNEVKVFCGNEGQEYMVYKFEKGKVKYGH